MQSDCLCLVDGLNILRVSKLHRRIAACELGCQVTFVISTIKQTDDKSECEWTRETIDEWNEMTVVYRLVK